MELYCIVVEKNKGEDPNMKIMIEDNNLVTSFQVDAIDMLGCLANALNNPLLGKVSAYIYESDRCEKILKDYVNNKKEGVQNEKTDNTEG